MFTREYLESLATATSFSRGQAYFRSAKRRQNHPRGRHIHRQSSRHGLVQGAADTERPASQLHDPLFGAELLLAENRPADQLPYLRHLSWRWQRSIPEVLALAAPTHPGDYLELVMEHTETLLQAPLNGRGRDRYQRIASWLAALNKADELRRPVALFAAHLYTEYARLNALREELRAAHLVRTELVGKQHKLIVSEAEDEEVRALLREKQAKPGRKKK